MLNILIVDDEPNIRMILGRILKKQNFNFDEASNVKEAKILLKKNYYDIILSDITMPGESGVKLAEFVLKNHQDTSIVMVTVMTDPEVATEVLQLGVHGYIIKPFDANQVLIQLSNALYRKELQKKNREYQQNLEQIVCQRTKKLQNTIKELTRVEKSLKTSEKKYRTLIETMSDGLGITDRDENLIYANSTFGHLLGYETNELIGKNLRGLIPEEDFPTVLKQTKSRMKGKKGHYEIPLKTKQNEIRSFLISASPFMDDDGVITGTLSILHDITDRKIMEKKLRESETRTKKILESVQSGIIIIDSETRKIIEANKAALDLIGAGEHEVLGHVCHKFICSKEKGQCPIFDKGRHSTNEECVLITIDGGKVPIIKNIVHTNLQGKDICIESFVDIRKLKETENALSQAQKLESIGQLAAGIAHEMNTPMQYIGDNTKFFRDAFRDINLFIEKYKYLQEHGNGNSENKNILDTLDDISQEIDLEYLTEEIPHSISETLEGVERVTKIVRSMKEFSHPGSKEKSFVDINHALESTVTVSRNEWKYVAELETKFDDSLPMVNCLPAELNQVFLNIIINAAHAIRDVVEKSNGKKGNITIETNRRGDLVQIKIIDTGSGIPQNIREKIYDPFFTTKEVGKGTGQGLYIAHDIIVNKHNGALKFESECGVGTTFIIELPIG